MVKNSMDERSGFNYQTQTYHSLRHLLVPLPEETTPLSITRYVFTLLYRRQLPPTTPNFLVDAVTRHRFSFSQLQSHASTLADSLRHRIGLNSGDTAFILSPNSLQIPLLYLSLFSIGVIVSPSNPSSSIPEISRQIHISNPVIAFATSETAHKLPPLRHPQILLDSTEFDSLISTPTQKNCDDHQSRVVVRQSDTAAVLYSSGTTGKSKEWR